jgi:TM2 domain-containing membrane protein YozV
MFPESVPRYAGSVPRSDPSAGTERLDNGVFIGERWDMSNAGQGSAGNVLSAAASIFIPGLGQLLQGRLLAAILFFVFAGVLWLISFGTLGWIMHLWSCLDAALWKPKPGS